MGTAGDTTRTIISLLEVLVVIAIYEVGSDFCAKDLCAYKQQHIACGNDGRFSRHCPTNARLIRIEQYRYFILAQHNYRRNLVAGGHFSHFFGAQRMATMAWSPELAALAELNVKQCRMRHDVCHNTNEFRRSGQNLGYNKVNTGGNYSTAHRQPAPFKHNVRFTLRQLIGDFFAEYKHIKMPGIRKYPKKPAPNGKIFSHFTVMVGDHNTHVGCAAAEYQRNTSTTFLLACNYARMNMIGRPVYAVGKPAQGCRTGANHKYRNLCSRYEQFANT